MIWLLKGRGVWKLKSVLRRGILFANPEVMHRPRSDSSLHFDIRNKYQIRTGKCFGAAAVRSSAGGAAICQVMNSGSFGVVLTSLVEGATVSSNRADMICPPHSTFAPLPTRHLESLING